MIPINIEVIRSKVKIDGQVGIRHFDVFVQLVTQERFTPEVSNLVGR